MDRGYDSNRKEHPADRKRAVSNRRPDRGKSRLPVAHQGLRAGDTQLLARRIAVDSFILLIASFAIGSHVLSFFGISLPVVQVGGGLIVISTGWAMLKQKDDNGSTVRRQVNCTDALRDAFYPLTLPLTVGPGSISIAITPARMEHISSGRTCWRF